MRDQSLSLHPYSGRDSDSYGLMTPMSANKDKTTKSSSISSNHSNKHSYISNHYSNNSDHNNNYSHTTSMISSPQSHHLHHQGYRGASSTNSSHSINNTEECVESILALPPSPILSKVPGLTDIQLRDLRHILPTEYMPGYFASKLLSRLHSTRARMGAVTTQSVNVKHTDKLPPPDASPRRCEKSSSSPPPPISSTQERGAETKSMTVVPASSSSAEPLALSSRLHPT